MLKDILKPNYICTILYRLTSCNFSCCKIKARLDEIILIIQCIHELWWFSVFIYIYIYNSCFKMTKNKVNTQYLWAYVHVCESDKFLDSVFLSLNTHWAHIHTGLASYHTRHLWGQLYAEATCMWTWHTTRPDIPMLSISHKKDFL